MKKLTFEKLIGIAMLLFAIGFNLYLYRLEPTAKTDPNDNTFQFALVDRTNTMWYFASKKCSSTISGIITYPLCHFSYLADHWVNNWAEGYNLPYYYSHIPQIAIVGSYRILHSLFVIRYSLFEYYHVVIYLLLCFIPLPLFLALRVVGLSWITAGVGAILSTHLSTDGLYGLDPSSFLWRGYGLSSQLFAMIWLPLALAYSYRFFASRETLTVKRDWKHFFSIYDSRLAISAVVFTTLTTAGHLGIGMITMLSLGFLSIANPLSKLMQQESPKEIFNSLYVSLVRLSLVAGVSIVLLSYWIVPTFIHGNFHNMSFWDPVWKFDSYGAMETMIRLFNGDLLDFGRIPILTGLTFLGIIAGLSKSIEYSVSSIAEKKEKNQDTQYSIPYTLYPFAYLFIFWILFYFGRTTWGGLIDLIPGMKDFHLSRFIVGVHVAAMFLVPIGFEYLASSIVYRVSRFTNIQRLLAVHYTVYSILLIIILPPVYRWTITYNELNDRLIVQANGNYEKVKTDEQALFARLRSLPPGRIFAGRGGGFGKRFEVAETPYYMHLSTYGLPTTLWLPETWSMNSDTEQYFSEDQAKDYDLYAIRWVAAPPDEVPKPFWKLLDERPTWKLYEVKSTVIPEQTGIQNEIPDSPRFGEAGQVVNDKPIGYFTTGVRPATISIGKQSFMTLVHLWIQSDMHKNGLFPEMTFDKKYPKPFGIPNFKMLDEVTYITPDGKKHNIWSEPPVYLPPGIASIEQYAALANKRTENMKLIGPETVDTDMIFSTTVEVGKNCLECVVVLKHTYHPGWKAYIDGKPAQTMIVFPFYTAISVPEGKHTISFEYTPSSLKKILLLLAFLIVVATLWIVISGLVSNKRIR